MFNARELLLIHAELDYIKFKDPEMQALCDKVHLLYRHQEMHEIMQEFLGVSKSYMIRLRDYDEVDVSGVPVPGASKPLHETWIDEPGFDKEMQNAACQLVYEGPNYNKPEDRSGVQGVKFRRLMPHPIALEDIDVETMNRILRTIFPNEMG